MTARRPRVGRFLYWQRFRVRARRTRATWGGTRDERGGDPRVSAPIRRDEIRRRPAPSSSPRQAWRALRRSGVNDDQLGSSNKMTCLARSARQKVNVFESCVGTFQDRRNLQRPHSDGRLWYPRNARPGGTPLAHAVDLGSRLREARREGISAHVGASKGRVEEGSIEDWGAGRIVCC